MHEKTLVFFREVTLRACSSLNVEKAMLGAYECLAAHFPLTSLHLDVHDQDLAAIRRVAQVSMDGVEPAIRIWPLPAHLWAWLQRLTEPVIVSPDPAEYPQDLRSLMEVQGFSEIILPLRSDGTMLGTLVLRCKGENRYTQEHAELLAGVCDPFSIMLGNALAHQELQRRKDELLDDKHFLNREISYIKINDIIGRRGGLVQVIEMAHQVAPLNNTILITGETGVGKEVIASAIHYLSPRSNGPFIKLNCGAIPEGLIDSELFGHEKGAFTSAAEAKRGRFERAQHGTLFLDEIGELSQQAQVRLLRVLQTKEIERVGGIKTLKVDVRVIAATHRSLEQMVKERTFREDLWFRINVFPINVPPLRHRREDIPALIRHFIAVKSRELGITHPPSITPGALARLGDYAWPGNVRELENTVERELIRNPKGPLAFDSLLSSPTESLSMDSFNPAITNLNEAMVRQISAVLKLAEKIEGPGGAAELLGINPATLRSRMKRLGMQPDRPRRDS